MAAEPHLDGAQCDDGEVMSAIDEVDGDQHLVIADVTRDDAWVSTPVGSSTRLAEWR